jgi:hypothetical protein
MFNPKPDRKSFMDRKHLANIRKLPSIVSGRTPCEAHHLRIKDERGVGMKATDRWAVPLTRDEHQRVHEVGSRMEEQWFAERGIDAVALAIALWTLRGDLDAMRRVIDG